MGVQRPPLQTLWVDMGLPSSNMWAVSSLDSNGPFFFQESPFQYEGSFFSWGNVTPHNPISETAFDYDFGGINSEAPWFEGQAYGETPGSLLTGDIPLDMDAARRLLGRPWRMPTSDDFTELFNNTDFVQADGETVIDASQANKLVTVNGIVGLYLKSKINGRLLFFPCTGLGDRSSWNYYGSIGHYWSDSFVSAVTAQYLDFRPSGVTPQNVGYRFYGFVVRPIWNPRDLRG